MLRAMKSSKGTMRKMRRRTSRVADGNRGMRSYQLALPRPKRDNSALLVCCYPMELATRAPQRSAFGRSRSSIASTRSGSNLRKNSGETRPAGRALSLRRLADARLRDVSAARVAGAF